MASQASSKNRVSNDEFYIRAGKLEVRASGRMAVTAVIAFLAIAMFVWLAGALPNLPSLVPSFLNGAWHRVGAAESARAPQCAADRYALSPRSEDEAGRATQ